jgi:hypothetical protein
MLSIQPVADRRHFNLAHRIQEFNLLTDLHSGTDAAMRQRASPVSVARRNSSRPLGGGLPMARGVGGVGAAASPSLH